MQLLTLGLNHQTAPVELRERVAFTEATIPEAIHDLTRSNGIGEATILSTCNRTELYCGNNQIDPQRVIEWLSGYAGFDIDKLTPCLYQYNNEQAVHHAFRVASGLDSMVLGEPQILGQMKTAFAAAQHAGVTGKVLNQLFQRSFSVAKDVRSNTAIGQSAVSVAYAGVSLAKRVFGDFSEQTALLIGAGETIELVARHFQQNGLTKMIIANRSAQRAQQLAGHFDAEVISLAQLPERLCEADVIVSSTASTLPILGKGAIEKAVQQRRHKPIFILDLAVPRDVEPEVNELRDVFLWDVDDLQSVIAENQQRRIQAAEEAKTIIDFQVTQFMQWMRSLDSVPLIRSLREKINQQRDLELQKALAKLNKGDDPATVLENFAHSLSNKIAHQPSQVLRAQDVGSDPDLMRCAKKLFDL